MWKAIAGCLVIASLAAISAVPEVGLASDPITPRPIKRLYLHGPDDGGHENPDGLEFPNFQMEGAFNNIGLGGSWFNTGPTSMTFELRSSDGSRSRKYQCLWGNISQTGEIVFGSGERFPTFFFSCLAFFVFADPGQFPGIGFDNVSVDNTAVGWPRWRSSHHLVGWPEHFLDFDIVWGD